MANRVILGRKNASSIGVYISKPGVDAFTASQFDLMLSTDHPTWQVVQNGRVSLPMGGSVTISHPNIGHIPTIFVLPHITNITNADVPHGGGNYPPLVIATWVDHVSMTQSTLRLQRFAPSTNPGYSYDGTATYAVMGMRGG